MQFNTEEYAGQGDRMPYSSGSITVSVSGHEELVDFLKTPNDVIIQFREVGSPLQVHHLPKASSFNGYSSNYVPTFHCAGD